MTYNATKKDIYVLYIFKVKPAQFQRI